MFNHDHARTELQALATDARYWRNVARTPKQEIFWQDLALVYDLALETFEYALERHLGVSCHPDADCDHEEPGFGEILSRIPSTAGWLTALRTTKQELAGEVSKTLLNLIGKLAQQAHYERLLAE